MTGLYGQYGGCFVPELLVEPLADLQRRYELFCADGEQQAALASELASYAGRPTPLTEVPRFSKAIDGPTILLKREDLLHTGAHKLNNALGQCLLAKYQGKRRIIAETGAGQHGVATATACARLGLECVVYMGAADVERQYANVLRMKLLGATVVAVDKGSRTLKDAINEALRDWAATYEDSHYCLGSALGPAPFPAMVRTFQSVIGDETLIQVQQLHGRLPDRVVACVGGGSNAIGIFAPFIAHRQVQLVGVEAGGDGIASGRHAARFEGGRPGVLHGTYTYVLQDLCGQVLPTHSVSAGLDYPAIGPEHANLFETGRAQYTHVCDQQAIEAMQLLSRTEGIIPAMESSHALAYMVERAHTFNSSEIVVINLSGRGDKDLPQLFSIIDALTGAGNE